MAHVLVFEKSEQGCAVTDIDTLSLQVLDESINAELLHNVVALESCDYDAILDARHHLATPDHEAHTQSSRVLVRW
jgi:hypothetical protein